MDHSQMDHSHMGHGGMGHGDMDMGAQCNMNVGREALQSSRLSLSFTDNWLLY